MSLSVSIQTPTSPCGRVLSLAFACGNQPRLFHRYGLAHSQRNPGHSSIEGPDALTNASRSSSPSRMAAYCTSTPNTSATARSARLDALHHRLPVLARLLTQRDVEDERLRVSADIAERREAAMERACGKSLPAAMPNSADLGHGRLDWRGCTSPCATVWATDGEERLGRLRGGGPRSPRLDASRRAGSSAIMRYPPRRSASAVAGSAGKNDSIASSDSVTSTGLPKIVVVLRNDSTASPTRRRSVATRSVP